MNKIVEIEKRILKFWRESNAFQRSIDKRPRTRNFVFYEGPPTANGKPGFHHVEARTFKDVICRYKTMQGFRVERRGGWDTHGLPVELEVERQLGINNKKEIEKYGIARFNKKCRESVWRYKKDWEDLTERMGFWIDIDNAYITYDPLYMETLWWIIKQMHEKDLLYEGYKVIPRCPRCGTGLSSHEVAQGYKDVTEDSVFVKFKVKSPKTHNLEPNTYLLAWTTTPWTLPGNVALAIGVKIKYSLVKQAAEYYILATELLDILDGEYEVLKEFTGKELVGIEYEPLFDSFRDVKEKKHFVTEADFVTTAEGTGIVHTSVMYGEDDYELGVKLGLPMNHTVDENGRFNELVKDFEGQFVKDAEPAIIDKLKSENKLYKVLPYRHSYPFCWRCNSPLLYYAMNSWFVAMGKLRKQLLDGNKKINWEPDYIKEGRFGEWLREVKDWAFSRQRYWGTPLPVWRCNDCDAIEVLGSREDLARKTRGHNEYFLLRHGQSESNAREILNSTDNVGFEDVLTKLGIKQVQDTAKKLKTIKIDFIIASPVLRTKQTAQIIAEELGVEIKYDNRVREIEFGELDDKPYSEYNNKYKVGETFDFKGKPKGGESKAEVLARTYDALKDFEKKYISKKILIISHADSIWHMRNVVEGLTQKEASKRAKTDYPENGKIYKIDFADFPYNEDGELDFHRPFVDKVEFTCTKCEKGTMRRVEDLVDVWFDSGSMPFAQEHYPFENKSAIEKGTNYPADYIAEAIDQTRGWFYTLHAVSAILGFVPAFKNVISLGHVLDEKGRKMSKSEGNIVDPWELADEFGMDAVRWYFFTVNNPGAAKRFATREVKERLQRFISTFLNSYTFLNTYSEKTKAPKKFSDIKTKNKLDIWMNARLKTLVPTLAICPSGA